ncbi:hypothetical protein AVEN_178351-1 [Araneus ventricosus]|uniref:Uncharacterized protein n=1 Tax=Araneus ventricosus TaxID=182803 RepID=A0A4Y2BF42_ARAVE|nr:hypothetical protein AVEN_178351-1 [Araneus ventricosus]
MISGVADDSTSQRSLEKLMSFVRHEVESEEMINLASEGFVKNGGLFKRNKGAVLDTTDIATTAMMVSTYSSYDGTSTEDPQILENLRVKRIGLSDDTCNENEIDLLIGAYLIGKLLTGSDDYPVMNSVQTVLSLYVNNASLRELWDIESLGIREPIENVSKRKAFHEKLKEFDEKFTVLPDDRYEVELSWKLDARANLPENKELALKRQEKVILGAEEILKK